MPGQLNLTNPINWSHESNLRLVASLHPIATSIGKTIRDLTGKNPGTLGSGSKWVPGGPPGIPSYVRHSASNVSIPGNVFKAVNGNGKVTIACWINPTSLGSYGSVFDTTSRHASFFINSATDGYAGAGGSANTITFNFSVRTKVWQFLVWTYDGSNIRVYINGRLLGSIPLGLTTFSETLIFGMNPSGGGSNFIGSICGQRVYARSMTAADAHKLYQEALGGWKNSLNWLQPKRALYAEPVQQVDVTPPTITVSVPGFVPGVAAPTITVTMPSGVAAPVALVIGAPPTITISLPSFEVAIGPLAPAPSLTITPPTFTAAAALPIAQPTQVDLGRLRRGESLSLSIHTDELPDACPEVVFLLEGNTEIKTISLPLTDSANGIFTLSYFLGAEFVDGKYLAMIQYTINGITTYHVRYFEVTGGEPQGSVIAVTEIRRALGEAVIMHREDGYISMGYNAKVEQ